MCLKLSHNLTVLFMIVVLNLSWLHKTQSTPIISASLIREALVKVPFGETVTLVCASNDEKHSFVYWYLNERDVVIGPGNTYDNGKFRYEVLSGNLTVKAVSKEEEGVYNCVSRGVKTDDVNVRSVRMVVQADWEEVYEEDPNTSQNDNDAEGHEKKVTSFKDRVSGVIFGIALPKIGSFMSKIREKRHELKDFINESRPEGDPKQCPMSKVDFTEKIRILKVNLFRVVIVLGSLMVLSGVGYAGYRIWKTRYRHPGYLIPSDDEEDSTEELFRTPGASRGNENIIKTNSTDSFETPGISTDFKSILDTANNK